MKLTLALLLVGFAAGSYAQVFQAVCRPTEVVFLLDHSENARKASTLVDNNNFQLLKEAWTRYMGDLQRLGNNLFRIWAWAYSSRATPIELVLRGSSPSQSIAAPIGSLSSGGSWTYVGLEQLQNQRPSLPNNVVIIISAQGSMNAQRRTQASSLYNTLAANGWNTYVIGVKSSNDIDLQELTAVNGNRNPVILDDNKSENKKSYSLLYNALTTITNSILCPRVVVTPRPTPRPTTRRPIITLPPFTLPPSTGICSNCRVNGGYGFDSNNAYCDLFYQCLPNDEYVLKHCSQSLIWDDGKGTCVRPTMYACPVGACNAQLIDTTYPSGVCCNMFFRCNGIVLVYEQCPAGQVYNENTRQCGVSANPIQECASRGAFYCNDRIWNEPVNCGAYRPDPLGSPCRYLHNDVAMNTSLGTMWDQDSCRLIKGDVCLDRIFSTRGLSDISDTCSAHILATFEANRPEVESPRDPDLQFYVRYVGVIKTRGVLVFRPNLIAAHAYYFFFNNNEIRTNSAFRLVFQLDNVAQSNVEYDLFSNNYCPLCPETIGATVRRTSQSSVIITTKFIDNNNNAIVSTSTQVDGIQNDNWLSLNVIWGVSDVHGVVKVMSSNKQTMNTIQIQPVSHVAGSVIRPNKCGILLGGGANTIFVGQIDEFAYYSTCANIEDVLRL